MDYLSGFWQTFNNPVSCRTILYPTIEIDFGLPFSLVSYSEDMQPPGNLLSTLSLRARLTNAPSDQRLI
ncbi:hypothetical protein DEFR109230_18980 [Deinococcus frigens]